MKFAGFVCLFALFAIATALAQTNPVPWVNQPLVPTATAPGGPSFKLTINGTGFVSGSVVNWNGTALTTTFVSSSQLTATVPAANIATALTASITVSSPSPGGGSSNVLFFEVSAPTDLKFTGVPLTPAGTQDCVSVGGLDCANFVVADLTGNGKLDLIYGGFQSEGAVVFGSGFTSLGNGDGTFQAPISCCSREFTFFVTADVNGDGKVDLVELDQGNGTFPTPYSLYLSLGNGNGTFSTPVQFASGTASSIYATDPAVADFNGDGKLDVAVVDQLGLEVYLGNGDGTFQPVLTSPGGALNGAATSLVVGDFNGDGKLDIAAIENLNAGTNGQLQILLGNGNGTFGAGASYSTIPNPGGIYAADFNGDDKLDLMFLAGSSTNGGPTDVIVILGNGDGTFGTGTVYPTSAGPIGGAAITDLNADGKLDVALANSLGTAIASTAIMLGNGDGTLQSPIVLPFFSYATFAPDTIAAGDFNNDGKMDLAIWTGNGIGALLQDYTPDFSLAAGSNTSATVAPGQTANYTVNVVPVDGFNQTVSLTCSGAPAQSMCTVSPSSVTLNGKSVAVSVSVVTTASAMGLTQPLNAPPISGMFSMWIALCGILWLGVLATLGGKGRARRPQVLGGVTLLCLLLIGITTSACGGGNSGKNGGSGTQAGTYNLTVTGTFTSGSSNLTHNMNFTLVVQ